MGNGLDISQLTHAIVAETARSNLKKHSPQTDTDRGGLLLKITSAMGKLQILLISPNPVGTA